MWPLYEWATSTCRNFVCGLTTQASQLRLGRRHEAAKEDLMTRASFRRVRARRNETEACCARHHSSKTSPLLLFSTLLYPAAELPSFPNQYHHPPSGKAQQMAIVTIAPKKWEGDECTFLADKTTLDYGSKGSMWWFTSALMIGGACCHYIPIDHFAASEKLHFGVKKLLGRKLSPHPVSSLLRHKNA